MKPRFVLDTNVYIGLLIKGKGAVKLFGYWRAKHFDLYTSKHQLQEIENTAHLYFQGKQAKKLIPEENLQALLRLLRSRAKVLPNRLVGQHSPDKDDDWIIAIALKAKAQYLVSENTLDINPKVIPKNSTLQAVTIGQALRVLES